MMPEPQNISKPNSLAVFISPHGFGHASRASAIMEALLRLNSALHYEIFSQTPAWFFDSLPPGSYTLHTLQTDVGLIQRTPIEEDIPATLHALDAFIAGLPAQAEVSAAVIQKTHCCLALCDISPLGIAAAKLAGIPSVLIENFTWDWIYSGYTARQPRFSRFVYTFQAWFRQADLHIQTEPICDRKAALPLCPPASRLARRTPPEVRELLQLPEERPVALVSLGSLLDQIPVMDDASQHKDWLFLLTDACSVIEHRENLVLLPQHTAISHPELLSVSSVLIAKAGYSTIAEAYSCGIPFGYLNRPQFPESPYLEEFMLREMPALEIPLGELQTGNWTRQLDRLIALSRRPHAEINGAECIARLIVDQID